ncbi:MAG TPA: hypothetical protein VN963_00750 [bacterium]|nr:hypothetical protein [bacterium]
MQRQYSLVLVLVLIFFVKALCAQEVKDLSKYCEIVSVHYSVPDNDQQNFADVDFRFGWNSKKPATIAVQFVNHSYSDRKFKFAIKDLTSKKMILLDAVHNSRLGSEALKPNSESAIWSGPVDNINDSFSLRVWNSNGDEFDKEPISIKDQQ